MRHQSPTLNNVADAATQLRGVFGDGVFAVDQNFARGGFDESVDHFYVISFAQAGSPANHQDLPGGEVKVQAPPAGWALARFFLTTSTSSIWAPVFWYWLMHGFPSML